MSKKELLQKIAYLEFINDQLVTELRYVDKLLHLVGFPNGLSTVKLAAQEIIDQESEEAQESD